MLAIVANATLLEFTTDAEITADPESQQAYDLIDERIPPDPPEEVVNELIVVRSDEHTVDDSEFEAKLADFVE